jgi:hypothetical protein
MWEDLAEDELIDCFDDDFVRLAVLTNYSEQSKSM